MDSVAKATKKTVLTSILSVVVSIGEDIGSR